MVALNSLQQSRLAGGTAGYRSFYLGCKRVCRKGGPECSLTCVSAQMKISFIAEDRVSLLIAGVVSLLYAMSLPTNHFDGQLFKRTYKCIGNCLN